jgi:Helix-turn-helix domain
MRLARRDKVFGPGLRVPLDREAKIRVMAYAKAWNARHRLPGQHRGPLTRATTEVLEALLWGFHNAASGACFPSYEAIAAKAECCRDTVCEAIKALAFAGVLTWVNRIVRERVRERDLFGQWVSRWRVLRTSNAYVFRDPNPATASRLTSRSESPPGTMNQGFIIPKAPSVGAATTLIGPLARSLASLRVTMEARGTVPVA